jgi:hypothetical protein
VAACEYGVEQDCECEGWNSMNRLHGGAKKKSQAAVRPVKCVLINVGLVAWRGLWGWGCIGGRCICSIW